MCCYRSRFVFSCGFEDTEVSQGSVATHLTCGGIFSDSIITNVLLILTVKKFDNWSMFGEVIKAYKKNCAKFFGPLCRMHHTRPFDA